MSITTMRTKSRQIATFHRPMYSHWSLPLSNITAQPPPPPTHSHYKTNEKPRVNCKVHIGTLRYIKNIITQLWTCYEQNLYPLSYFICYFLLSVYPLLFCPLVLLRYSKLSLCNNASTCCTKIKVDGDLMINLGA